MAELSCSLCHFTTDSHEEWGNHVISAHCGSFQPIIPPYLAHFQYQQQPPQFHFSLPQPRFSFASTSPTAAAAAVAGTSTVKLERPETASPYQGYAAAEEKENSFVQVQKPFQVLHQLPATYLQKNDQLSLPQLSPTSHQNLYSQNPYQVVINQFQKCPYCQYLGSTQELLQGHILSEHTVQDKVYSDLKPVHPDLLGDHSQLINLVHQEPRQQLYMRERSPTQAAVQPTVFVQNNFISAAGTPPVSVSEFCDNGLASVSTTQTEPDIKDAVVATVAAQNDHDQSLVNKINLVTIATTSDDVGIEGVVVSAAQKSKKRRSKSDGTGRVLNCEVTVSA